ncbi:MAG TPA: hypothetical protein VFU88_12300 [Ktedonobacterales bacterium]|nr:hypothetical protein [Ktedonobacterales bacterium]
MRWPRDTSRHRAVFTWGPCRPCTYVECPIGYRCLVGVSVEAVLREAEALLGAQQAAPKRELVPPR